jgi:uncharacterized damage-inducible protein DinB
MTQTLNPYAKFLDGQAPLDVIAKTPATLQALVMKASAPQLTKPSAPGKWSVREILCHLADCELVFGFRLRQTVAEDNPTIQPFDQDHWATNYSRMDASQALSVFSAFRDWNIAFIRASGPEAMQRKTTHPERGAMTFQTIVETMGGHDINHLKQVEGLLK